MKLNKKLTPKSSSDPFAPLIVIDNNFSHMDSSNRKKNILYEMTRKKIVYFLQYIVLVIESFRNCLQKYYTLLKINFELLFTIHEKWL